MSTLPTRVNLRQLRLLAKDLLKAYRSGSADANSRIRNTLPRLHGASDEDVIVASCTLQDMQHVLAVEYGFDTWGELRRYVEAASADPLEAAMYAVTQGDLDGLKTLISDKPDLVNQRPDPNGGTLLGLAATSENPELVRFLISVGADIHARSGEGWMPLHIAAEGNFVENVNALLDGGADVCAEACGVGGTALAHALFSGARQAAELLAERNVTPANTRVAAGLGDVSLLRSFFRQDGGLTPEAGRGRGFYRHHGEYPEWAPTDDPQEILDEAFVYACLNGRREAADLLLDHGADINGMPYYMSGLHAAVYRDDQRLVEELVARGADLSVREKMHGGTPHNWSEYLDRRAIREFFQKDLRESDLRMAIRTGQTKRLRALAEKATKQELTQAWKIVAARGKEEMADLLIKAGGDPTLFDLIDFDLTDAVAERLSSGDDPNATRIREVGISGQGITKVSQTALQAAGSAGKREIGNLLAQAGANIDLHGAAFLGRLKTVRSLLGDDHPDAARDVFGKTALHRAIQGGAEDVVRWLIAKGASVATHADTYTFGARALHVAAEAGASSSMIDLLIKAGADVNEEKNPGTPVAVAVRSGKHETAELLRARGGRG